MSSTERGKAGVSEWLQCSTLEKVDGLPDFGFRLRFDHDFSESCQPFSMPRLHQIPPFVRMAYRYTRMWLSYKYKGRKLCMDNFNLCPWRPIYGVPIGGLGCGTIGRGYRGEFCRFQMIPGMYKYSVVNANQFIVCIRRNGETVYQRVLSPHKAPSHGLGSWTWQFPAQDAVYHALYPRSWTVYWIREWNVRLVCRQISPIFPNDYQDTSLPCATFVWTIENHSDEMLDVSIVFTFKNGQGDLVGDDTAGGVWNQTFNCSSADNALTPATDVAVSGVLIHQTISNMKCTYGVASRQLPGVDISRTVAFDPCGSGRELWDDLQTDGQLTTSSDESHITRSGTQIACAVCARSSVGAGEMKHVEFCLTWDMPVIHFGGNENLYRRRYTRYFGADGQAAPKLAFYALNNYSVWEEKIEEWQNSVLKCSQLPAWYKSALFNELYYVSDGGTIWVDFDVEQSTSDVTSNIPNPLPQVLKEYGRFAYLEGHEYRMYNTYDVHFYASFALIMLWPKLQFSIQHDIALSVPNVLAKQVQYCMSGKYGVRKEHDCVPHDVGDPDDEPWVRVNAYMIHPTQEWKDLNLNFVLSVYRDFVFTGDHQYLQDMYPAVKTIMKRSLRWDVDGDGVIDNSGFADQTFDAWAATGASAYCGGMWLAAMKVFCEMASLQRCEDDLTFFTAILEKAKVSFEKKLWNGKYYNYDCSDSSHHNSVMAAQLVGQWFLKASKIPDDAVFPKQNVLSALKTIFDVNVMPFDGGRMGAINGARPDGTKDVSHIQADEFWVGVTYALAATMIQEGMMEEAWQTAYGAYHVCYERYGLGFQTPEAYYDDRRYRSLGYMRPLCIWAIQHALVHYQPALLQ